MKRAKKGIDLGGPMAFKKRMYTGGRGERDIVGRSGDDGGGLRRGELCRN